jgi:hypothetical protein
MSRPTAGIGDFSIATCQSLRTLTFGEASLRIVSSYVNIILSQISSSLMEKIIFRIRYADPSEINTFPLEKVEEILTGPLFSGLQTITFNLYGGEHRSGADDILPIRLRMKVLDQKGILRFAVKHRSVS